MASTACTTLCDVQRWDGWRGRGAQPLCSHPLELAETGMHAGQSMLGALLRNKDLSVRRSLQG